MKIHAKTRKLEAAAEIHHEGADQGLLRPLAHRGEGLLQAIPAVAHVDPIIVGIKSLKHLMPSGDHLRQFRTLTRHEDVKFELAQVVVELPLLEPLDPSGYVQHAAHEVLVVGSTKRRGDEGHDVHRAVERLGESDVLRDEPLGVADPSFLHEVGDGADHNDAALRHRKPAQQLEEGRPKFSQETSVNSDDDGAHLLLRGEDRRHVLISEEDEFPAPLPEILLIPQG
jgi:hypothetical protein